MLRLGIVALLFALSAPLCAGAQAYPAAAPAPRTTAAAQLAGLAVDREVVERFRRGLAAAAQLDWKTSAQEFSRVVALDPPEPRGSTAHYDLGIAEAHIGAYAAAEADFNAALQRDHEFAAAAANLVETALLAGDITLARDAANRFVAIAPGSLRARYSRGLVALKQNDLETARADFALLIERSPAYALAHYDLAVTEIRSGQYAEAQSELEAALALSPNYTRARFALATLLIRDDRPGDASANLARVVREADDPSLRALATTLRDQIDHVNQ
jgi:tetratricopeptide (TPR) repeat protein